MAFTYLSRERIAEIKKAFLDAHISYRESRELLMTGIDRSFVANLRTYSSDQYQLSGDLKDLNSVEFLADAERSVPLRTWLENAVELFTPRTQASIFVDALRDMGREDNVIDAEYVDAGTEQSGKTRARRPDPTVEGMPTKIPEAEPPARREIKESLVTTVRNDIVNLGFSSTSAADNFLPKYRELKCNESYYFWFNVGYALEESIGTAQPLHVENLPAEVHLKVALFAFENELIITPGQDVGELRIQRNPAAEIDLAHPPLTSVIVTRQPTAAATPTIPLSEKAAADTLEHFLFFPVQTPAAEGNHRLRCNIYCGQVLVQSHLIDARVMREPAEGHQALSAKVDYALSHTLRLAHLAAIASQPHRLSLMINSSEDGSHNFRFFGADGSEVFKADAQIDGQQMQNFLGMARRVMKKISWGSEEEWKQGQKNQYRYGEGKFEADKLARDLAYLARAGWRIYAGLLTQLKMRRQKLEAIMSDPGSVQIALKLSPPAVLPAAVIYDYPWDTEKYDDFSKTPFELCPTFAAAIKEAEDGDSLLESKCFKGQCSLKAEIQKLANGTVMDLPPIICPSGFWGYRHDLGFPLTLNGSSSEAPPVINIQDKFRLTAGVSTDPDFVKRDPHFDKLKTLSQGLLLERNNGYREIMASLKAAVPHLLYFYCHGGMLAESNLPYLEIGAADRVFSERLLAADLSLDESHPLVFINGCHTTALDPEVTLNFVSYFVQQAGASGVIGTEITIFEELAVVFAEECLARFVGSTPGTGVPIGRAVRAARLELLRRGNPLGLVYIPFAMAGLHLQSSAATPSLENH